MIISPRLPEIKGLLPRFRWDSLVGRHLRAMVIGILCHCGRMTAQQAASAVTGDSRHRGTLGRFLARHGGRLARLNVRAAERLLRHEGRRGRYVLIVDATNVTHQSERLENSTSTGNRQRRHCRQARYSKRRHAPKRFHASVWGLLLTPDGKRIPFHRGFRTRAYCQAQKLDFRSHADLAAEMIRALPLPAGADVVVLGDTAFESKQLRAACAQRGYVWIAPANAERVLNGEKPRPRLWSLVASFTPSQFALVRLDPNTGKYAAMRRRSLSRHESKNSCRTFYVHEEKRNVHSLGETRIVFSTKQLEASGELLKRERTKLLLTNAERLTTAEIVELYLLRWQIELFFKELKSELGMHQYRFRDWNR
jgi:hypothetical protein